MQNYTKHYNQNNLLSFSVNSKIKYTCCHHCKLILLASPIQHKQYKDGTFFHVYFILCIIEYFSHALVNSNHLPPSVQYTLNKFMTCPKLTCGMGLWVCGCVFLLFSGITFRLYPPLTPMQAEAAKKKKKILNILSSYEK